MQSQIYISLLIQRMLFIILFQETDQFRKVTNYRYYELYVNILITVQH